MKKLECKLCGRQFSRLSNHVRRTHGIKFRDYLLKHEFGDVVPLCECGCGKEVFFTKSGGEGFNKFIHGHHSAVRKRSDEERARIGAKNSERMKQFFTQNPMIMRERVAQMQSARSPESEQKRLQATRDVYSKMTNAEKEKFRRNCKKLWEDGTLSAAHPRAVMTFIQRSADGQYDFTERNEKLSKAIIKKYQEGGFQWSRGHYTSSKTGKIIYYRSSWELKMAQELDADDDVKWWEYEFVIIPYELDGKKKRYLPDFHVMYCDGTEKLIEVKPASMRDLPMNEAKRFAARIFCEQRGWQYDEYQPN